MTEVVFYDVKANPKVPPGSCRCGVCDLVMKKEEWEEHVASSRHRAGVEGYFSSVAEGDV